MMCNCGGGTEVVDSRKTQKGQIRKRLCHGCGAVFATLEQMYEAPIVRRWRPSTSVNLVQSSKLSTKLVDKPPSKSEKNTAIAGANARSRIDDMRMARALEAL